MVAWCLTMIPAERVIQDDEQLQDSSDDNTENKTTDYDAPRGASTHLHGFAVHDSPGPADSPVSDPSQSSCVNREQKVVEQGTQGLWTASTRPLDREHKAVGRRALDRSNGRLTSIDTNSASQLAPP